MPAADQPAITTFLMFQGDAEQAINCYVEVFENSRIESLTKYGPGEQGAEGSVQLAVFTLNGQKLMCVDSPVQHAFTFTPAISLYVTSSDEAQIDRYFEKLSEGGQILMPLDQYPFSRRFAWVQDRFGVSWQLCAT